MGILSMFAEDTNLGVVVASLENNIKIVHLFDEFGTLSAINRVKLNKNKCKVLHLEKSNQIYK